MKDYLVQHNQSEEVEAHEFPEDNKQLKCKEHWTNSDGDKVALNMNTDECFDNAPVVEIPKEDFDYYMQVFEKYETDKKKRAECQKKYFQNNKKSYYERQKKWRDGHKMKLNLRRREKYAENKLLDVAGNDVTSLGEAEPSSVTIEEVVDEQEVSAPEKEVSLLEEE